MASASEQKIYIEQIKMLYQNFKIIVPGNLFVGLVVLIMAWQTVDKKALLLWYLGLIIILAIRYIDAYQFKLYISQTTSHIDQWEKRFIAGIFATGVAWGILFELCFIPTHPELIVFVVCIYAGLVSAGNATSSARLLAFILFTIPASLPLIISMLNLGNFTYGLMGFTCFIFMLTSIIIASTYNRLTTESIRLRFENIDLITNLEQEKARAEDNQYIAEQAVVAKDRFLAAASHDLRQPLHAQGLYLDAIEPYVKPQGFAPLESLRKTNQALANLFNSLLDVSRLNAGIVEVNPRHLALKELSQTLYEEHKSRALEKNLTLTMECADLIVFTDPILLERILRNLLSNAIRYTKSGSIDLTCYLKENGMISIAVSDTGIGIPEEELENIFTEYYQLNNSERDRHKGLGLGLAIVKKLCDLLNISLICHSTLGKGSTFSLEVIPGKTELTQLKPNIETLSNQLNKNILIIDDEVEILESTAFLLKSWGCNVITAESEAQALDKIQQVNFKADMIIADYRLREEQTGAQAITNLRNYYKKSVPAMIITGDTHQDRLQEAKASGLFLLHKPVAPAKLRTAIQRLSAFTTNQGVAPP